MGGLGAPLGRIGAFLGRLGAPMGRMGARLGRLGAPLGRLGVPLGRLGASLELSRGVLGLSWCSLVHAKTLYFIIFYSVSCFLGRKGISSNKFGKER